MAEIFTAGLAALVDKGVTVTITGGGLHLHCGSEDQLSHAALYAQAVADQNTAEPRYLSATVHRTPDIAGVNLPGHWHDLSNAVDQGVILEISLQGVTAQHYGENGEKAAAVKLQNLFPEILVKKIKAGPLPGIGSGHALVNPRGKAQVQGTEIKSGKS